jgi:beta-N-acetylhexosaminidase
MTVANTGRLIIDFAGTQLDASDLDLLREPEVGGAILFSRNFESRRQVQELVGEIRAVKVDALICVDQEGGRVQRFTQGFAKLPSLQQIRRYVDANPEQTQAVLSSLAWLMAVEVLSTGVDLSFAPVLDLDECSSSVIGDRSLSPDADRAIQLASIYLDAMHIAGMATTGKHFPGHGAVTGDSHHEQPIDTRSFEEIQASDLRPFVELASKLDALMPAHVVYPEVDANPAGFSRRWIQEILRRDLNYSGVVFSDDLSMQGAASAGGGVDRAKAAIEAGCDLLLVCNDRDMAIQVQQWMADNSVPGSDAVMHMLARRRWTDSEIISDKNYSLANNFIKEIEESIASV